MSTFDRFIIAPHTAACIADETTCRHEPTLTAKFTSWAGEKQSFTIPLSVDIRAAFVELSRWDGPEVLNALCIAGVLTGEDFGGQGDLVGRDLDSWEITPAVAS